MGTDEKITLSGFKLKAPPFASSVNIEDNSLRYLPRFSSLHLCMCVFVCVCLGLSSPLLLLRYGYSEMQSHLLDSVYGTPNCVQVLV